MKKWSEKKTEAITWGDYANWCKWSIVISLILGGIAWIGTLVWYYYDEISEKIQNFITKVKTKFKK